MITAFFPALKLRNETKRDVIQEKRKSEREKEKIKQEEEQYEKEERDQMALEMYEKWMVCVLIFLLLLCALNNPAAKLSFVTQFDLSVTVCS